MNLIVGAPKTIWFVLAAIGIVSSIFLHDSS